MADADPSGTTSDLQFVLQETRTVLLQQILASDTGTLSVTELTHRNPDVDDENVRYHLRTLTDRGIVDKRKIPVGSRVGDLPNTFFTVTEKGEALLERAGLFEEVELWEELYDRMERTDEIERVERLKRTTRFEPTDQTENDTQQPDEESSGIDTSSSGMERVSLRMSKHIVEDVERRVESGEFPNRSTAMREAIDRFLRERMQSEETQSEMINALLQSSAGEETGEDGPSDSDRRTEKQA